MCKDSVHQIRMAVDNLPLYEIIPRKNRVKRAIEVTLLFLLISLLIYRWIHLKDGGLIWLLAFLCESWFTFTWVLVINIKWSPVYHNTYPQRLQQRKTELPPVDMFVTTADPVLEPPIITVNTVLSLMAVDYPENKLACYVSDDGCSPITYFALVEAAKFAKLWVPFCKKYNVPVRAPFRYFSGDDINPSNGNVNGSLEFQQAWKAMKDKYEQLSGKIEEASRQPVPSDLTGDLAPFSHADPRNHASIVKIISENKEAAEGEGLPHLIYISREKRPNHPHHYKAGAMNVLCRVSGIMTNAPFMLNVDCDMYANNPQIVQHAMCIFLGSKSERESGFVQAPQMFYDGEIDDPFGNQLVVIYEYMGRGIVGIQGPFYGGTGCIHRRRAIYGSWPDDEVIEKKNVPSRYGKDIYKEEILKGIGRSKELIHSAALALNGIKGSQSSDLFTYLMAVHLVANCDYEYATKWGKEVGWIYGSMVEDIMTGLNIHSKGYRTGYCSLNPPAFLGSAPTGGPTTLIQQRRWGTGLFEVLFTSKSPIKGTLQGHLQFRQCLAYLWILFWPLRSIPELLYALLPAYCLITGSNFMPNDATLLLPTSIFLIYNVYGIWEYISFGLPIRAWWNNLKMQRITSVCAWTFGVLNVILKLLGISETVFEVTKKEHTPVDNGNVDIGRFTFDESPTFIPGTTLMFVHVIALSMALSRLQPPTRGEYGSSIGEVVCSAWLLLAFLPFIKGLFGKGQYGIPLPTICKAGVLATIFVNFCRLSARHSL